MNRSIIVIYKSVTGFTEKYAKWIAEKLECNAVTLSEISEKDISSYDTVIFGGRLHAGFVDGLKKVKKLLQKNTSSELIVFATGATPNTAEKIIAETWKNNFSSDELSRIPHYYMQSGLRYEQMPLGDKLMMKAFGAIMKKKKDKADYEKEMEKILGKSSDFSSKQYIEPLVSYVLDRDSKCIKGEQEKAERTETTCFMNMCMIKDENGNVLALDKVDEDYSGTTFPGGHVEKNETFADSIIREVKEETGLLIRNPVLSGVYHWVEDDIHSVIFLYKATEFSGTLQSSEEGKVYWTPLDTLGEKALAVGMEAVLKIMESSTINECYVCLEGDGYVRNLR